MTIEHLHAKYILECFVYYQIHLSRQSMSWMLLLPARCGWGNQGKGHLRNMPRVPQLVSLTGTRSVRCRCPHLTIAPHGLMKAPAKGAWDPALQELVKDRELRLPSPCLCYSLQIQIFPSALFIFFPHWAPRNCWGKRTLRESIIIVLRVCFF